MEMCARCHKRVAVVYVTKIENGQSITEGICLKCASARKRCKCGGYIGIL